MTGRPRSRFALTLAATLTISACTFVENVETSLLDYRSVNMKERTYAAADMLSQQTKVHLSPRAPLSIDAPTDIETPGETTAFGEELAAQLGARFIQLGYNVQAAQDTPVDAAYGSAAAASPSSPGAMKPQQMGAEPSSSGNTAILGGTYARVDDYVEVSLKVFQASNRKLLAAYDYSLPLTPDLKNKTMTEAERARKEKYPVGTFLGLGRDAGN